jgi:hypothetical protein
VVCCALLSIAEMLASAIQAISLGANSTNGRVVLAIAFITNPMHPSSQSSPRFYIYLQAHSASFKARRPFLKFAVVPRRREPSSHGSRQRRCRMMGLVEAMAAPVATSRYRWPRGGFSGAFHSHTQEVAFTMDGFTIGIDLARFKINGLVADGTIYL